METFNFRSIQPVFVMLTAAMVSVVLCLALYFYDNKYTWNSRQPEQGALVLTAEDLAQTPVHFLIDGWEYYPDRLLEPSDFNGEGAQRNAQSVSVGMLGHMDRRGEPGWTGGTFRLVFSLPETSFPCAVGLPPIPSSSRVYLDGRLVVQNGNPSLLRTAMKSLLLPVEGNGERELILQVADWSSAHSSMFSPPMLGVHQKMLDISNTKNLLNTVVLVLTAVSGLLSLHLAVLLKWWRGFLFFLLCICFLGYEAMPFFSSYTAIGIQPWYAVRIFSFYCLFWLAVILENDLYRIRAGKVSAVMGIFCLLSMVYGCYVQYLPSVFSEIFQYMTSWYKFAAAFYLILVANAALAERMERSQTLLAMGTAFIAMVFMEQVLPFYEPVRGASFTVIGCVVLVVGLLSILWQDMVDAFRVKEAFLTETGRINRQLAMQKEHYKQLNARIEETRRLRHDMRHHIRMLCVLAESGDMQRLREYLKKLAPSAEQGEALTYTTNSVLDAVLCHYITAARQAGIRVNCVVAMGDTPCLPEDELCVLFGNLLENAVEACQRQTEGDRYIYLRCRQETDCISIVLDNSYDGCVRYQRGYLRSSKEERVGIGVESVKTIVEKHGGMALFEPKESVFEVSVMIPLNHDGGAVKRV